MMEQEQIEEMAFSSCWRPKFYKYIKTCKNCDEYAFCVRKSNVEDTYKAGYRKASEVIDEFVERLKELLNKHEHRSQTDGVPFYQINAESFCDEINKLAAEMRQEVDNDNKNQ